MLDRFFLLAGLEVEIDAAVMIFAKFVVQSREKFAERLAVPRHELGKEQCGNRSIALWQIHAGADAAAFFATNQDILLEHQLANVFKADGNFVHLSAEFQGEFVDELCDRESFRDFAFKLACADEVPDEQRENLMWIDEAAVAIDRANAVAVAVGGEANVVFAAQHGLPQRIDVRLDRLRMRAAKKRIARPSDFVARNAVAFENLGQNAGGGAVHRVGDVAEFRFSQAIPIDKLFDGFDVRRAGIERLNEIFLRWQRRNAVRNNTAKLRFDLCHDRWQRAAAVAGFVLDAVPARWIVAGGDH